MPENVKRDLAALLEKHGMEGILLEIFNHCEQQASGPNKRAVAWLDIAHAITRAVHLHRRVM